MLIPVKSALTENEPTRARPAATQSLKERRSINRTVRYATTVTQVQSDRPLFHSSRGQMTFDCVYLFVQLLVKWFRALNVMRHGPYSELGLTLKPAMVSEHFQSTFRAVSEQFQSSFRAVSEQF